MLLGAIILNHAVEHALDVANRTYSISAENNLAYNLNEMNKQSRREARRNRKARTRKGGMLLQSVRAKKQAAGESIAIKRFLSKFWAKVKFKLTFKRVIEIVLALIGVISAYIGILGYWMPRISVQPLNPINSIETISTDFSVTNAGSTPLYNIRVGCRVNNYKLMILGTDYEILEASSPEDFYDRLDPMKSSTMKCKFAPEHDKDLDVFITVYYRPAWYPYEQRQAFRFVTKTLNDGQVHWLPRPESDNWPF